VVDEDAHHEQPEGLMPEQPLEPDAVVTSFTKSWSTCDVDTVVAFFADDGVWHNMPMEPVVGRDAVRSALENYYAVTSNHRYDIHQQITSGTTVMHERTDTMTVGDRTVTLPVVGVFEVEDGMIRTWRDYFDMSTFLGS
jgi:limonene-1,2-epoxide hydrolase